MVPRAVTGVRIGMFGIMEDMLRLVSERKGRRRPDRGPLHIECGPSRVQVCRAEGGAPPSGGHSADAASAR